MEGPGYDLNDLTPMLSRFMDASGNIDPSRAPPDMTDLLERLKGFQQMQQQGVEAPAGSQPTFPLVITPKPGFVVKAMDTSGQKLFINIATSEHVVSPALWRQHQGDDEFKERIEEAVKVAPGKDSELLRFPMSLGDPRHDRDRNGDACTVLDVVFSPQAIEMAERSRPLKTFLVELALAWAARAHGLQLGGYGQWKLPKMRYKGDSVVTQKLRLQRNEPRVEEIGEPSTSGGKPRQAPAKFSEEAYAQLQQASGALKRSSTAEEAAGALPAASGALQSQHAAQGGQSSTQTVKADAPDRKVASDVPSSSAAISPEPAVPAEQRVAAIDAAPPVQSTSQPPKESTKGPAANRKPVPYSVDFHGRPVESVTVTLDLTDHGSKAFSSDGFVPAPTITVRRDQVLVEMHERAPLQINLPFGVDARQGRARHVDAEQRLILELPYKSYRSCTQDTCKKLPLIDDFGFPDSYFMQLET